MTSLIDSQNTLEQGQIIEKDIKYDTITVGLSACAAPEIPWFGHILTLIAPGHYVLGILHSKMSVKWHP